MSNLKKEFKKRDVERMRNLITGKHGKKTTLGIGYTKKQKHHEEGDAAQHWVHLRQGGCPKGAEGHPAHPRSDKQAQCLERRF